MTDIGRWGGALIACALATPGGPGLSGRASPDAARRVEFNAEVRPLLSVRSMFASANNHDPAIAFFQAGSQIAGRPSATLLRPLGVDHERPPYLHQGRRFCLHGTVVEVLPA